MYKIVELNETFRSAAVYQIYSACMYQPTWEKFCKKAESFLRNDNIAVLGAIEDSAVLGVIVLEMQGGGNAEIIGIAVDPVHRRRGIGQQMVRFSMETLHAARLYAETDDDAVSFYRSCGFAIDSHVEKFPDGEVIRYQCILKNSESGLPSW